MELTEYFNIMARYNQWMNERIYGVCTDIPDDERKMDRGAFFKSIHGTLNHLLLADRLWLGRFKKQPFSLRSLDQELYDEFDDLRAEREATDEEILEWTEDLSNAMLESQFSFTSIVNPGERTYPFSFVLMHFFNHQTHHRGQVSTLIKQAGFDVGETDLIWLPGVEA